MMTISLATYWMTWWQGCEWGQWSVTNVSWQMRDLTSGHKSHCVHSPMGWPMTCASLNTTTMDGGRGFKLDITGHLFLPIVSICCCNLMNTKTKTCVYGYWVCNVKDFLLQIFLFTYLIVRIQLQTDNRSDILMLFHPKNAELRWFSQLLYQLEVLLELLGERALDDTAVGSLLTLARFSQI